MKKLLALLLVLVMLFSVATVFAGCEDGGKKKSSSSKNDDDDDDEDEDEEDEDNEDDKDDKDNEDDKNDESTGDKNEGEIDVTEPSGNKATEPKATEPKVEEPTENPNREVMSYIGVEKADLDQYLISACVSNNGTVQSFTIGKQKTASGEGILYYSDNNGDFFVKIEDDCGYLYVYDGYSYVLDTSASDQDIMSRVETCVEALSLFIDIESILGDSVGYRPADDYNGYACYEAYMNGTLVRNIYLDYETGMVVCIQDADGNDLVWMEDFTTDVTLSDYID